MIAEKIKKDITDEFVNLKRELQTHVEQDSVDQAKKFLQTHIPKEIISKSKVLLDTLLNYLMQDARERIRNSDIKIQNAFFDADFRKRTRERVSQLLEMREPDILNYLSDPRLKQGLVIGGATFTVGSLVTGMIASKSQTITMTAGKAIVSLNPHVVAATIVSGIVTILVSTYKFKSMYDKASPKAREIIKTDIDQYLEVSQKQVSEWLEKVSAAFEKDFQDFCLTNGIALE